MSNIIMNSYLERKQSALEQAQQIGTELKMHYGKGKEYYAVYCTQGDTILDWLEMKVREFYPESGNSVSYTNIIFELDGKGVFQVARQDASLLYVHKKRFKRFLKKVVHQAKSRW